MVSLGTIFPVTQRPDVVVIGAGAAGILAAWRAAQLGARVVLLEKTPRIGTKILISGGGKCNVAHAGPLEDVIRAFRPSEARFIRPACYRLTNEAIVKLMTERGLRVYTRPDGRVFPIDQTAKDVVAILRGYLDESGVDIRLNSPVEAISTERGKVAGVSVGEPPVAHAGFRRQPETRYGAKALLAEVLHETETPRAQPERYSIECERVVVASGGSSYPNSGTTGDGWIWARTLGHRVDRLGAALAPIYLVEPRVELAGVALRDCVLKAARLGKEIARWRGDLLFTHQGVSGPAALGISRVVAERMDEGAVALTVDIAPDQSHERLSAELADLATQNPRKLASGFVANLAPESVTEKVAQAAALPADTIGARFDKKARNRLVEGLKSWRIGDVRHVPLEKGEVVAGGISLDEVDPQSMRSRIVDGLYVCGEALSVAGPVGGYNLQAAFATGFLAGETAARDSGAGA